MEDYRKAFGEIYDKYIDKIYRFIFLKVNSREAAEDLCSETFLKTWNVFRGDSKAEIENIQAFLYKVARNLVTDYYRKNNRAQIVPMENIQLINHRIDLEKDAALRSDLNTVSRAIAELKDDYQNVLIWRYLDDLSVSEIGQLLGRTESATRVLLHRAIKAVRNKLEM